MSRDHTLVGPPTRGSRPSRVAVTVLVLAMFAALVPSLRADAATPAVSRLSGPERVATSVAVARHGWTASSTVVLARADDPADALAGSALAAGASAPLLVTPSDGVHPLVAKELARLGARRAILLGGESALHRTVSTQLQQQGLTVDRVAGPTRHDTAAAIARRLGAGGSERVGFIVGDWRGALAVAGAAARRAAEGAPAPVLLSSSSLHPATATAIQALGLRRIVIADAGGSVHPAVADQLRALGVTVERIATRGAEELSVRVAERFPSAATAPTLLVTSATFPDALSAGALAGRTGADLLLTTPADLADPVSTWLGGRQGAPIIGIGGQTALPESVLTEAAAATWYSSQPALPERTVPDVGLPAGFVSAFVSEDDLAMWRQRAHSGPYRTTGDVAPDSPGEWDDVVARAAAFRADPAGARWAGPVDNNPGGAVQKDLTYASDPELEHHTLLSAAAFHALVTGDATAAHAVGDALLAQSREPGLDFADRERWAYGALDDINPLFMISSWAASLLLAMDHLEAADPTVFTPAERAELHQWFYAFGELLHHEVEHNYGRRTFRDWAERSAPPFTPHPGTVFDVDDTLERVHDDVGPVVTTLSKGPNNRRAQLARTLGMIGLKLGAAEPVRVPPGLRTHQPEDLVSLSVKFFKTMIAYATFSGGYSSELHRGAKAAGYGWSYTWTQLAPYATMAHLLADRGDRTLFDYRTRVGHQTTVLQAGDPDKSFAHTVRTMAGYTRGEGPTRDGVPIDGSNISGGTGYHDLGTLAVFLRHHHDADVDATIRRDPARGMDGYTTHAITSYRTSRAVFAHDWHVFPGSLFYFGHGA